MSQVKSSALPILVIKQLPQEYGTGLALTRV
jgi:hypothetical protein